MKKRICVIIIFLIFTIPLFARADTLILESGRKIEASRCWHEAEIIKCEKFGQIIGFSKSEVNTVILDRQAVVPVDGFLFDIWMSGITVAEAINLAQEHDIPLHKAGIISVDKNFNPKLCVEWGSGRANRLIKTKKTAKYSRFLVLKLLFWMQKCRSKNLFGIKKYKTLQAFYKPKKLNIS